MKNKVVEPVNDQNEKKAYLREYLSKNPLATRKYNEVNKYCKIVKMDLENILINEFEGGDLNKFLEGIFRDVLVIYFKKMLEFENVNNEEELYNTLYYLSFEYIKIVKKDEQRKSFVDKSVPDLKVMVEFFSSQALTKDSFKNFNFEKINSKTVVGFLLENNIKMYQSKSKNISKEESEATIVYSLINLYMTSELERVFLTEHLKKYEEFKKNKEKLNQEIIELDNQIKEIEKNIVDNEVEIETTNIKLDNLLNHNKILRKLFYEKKISNIEKKLADFERKQDTLENQNKNNKKKSKNIKTKLTKSENEFKASFELELKQLNEYYETELIINIEDFESKNKLKKKSATISKDIVERLENLGIKVENTNLSLNDYVELKELVNDYKKRFSNKNVYHNKIVELLDQYGYYLKNY